VDANGKYCANPGPGGPFGASCTTTYTEGIYVGYRRYDQQHLTPLYPFGYGLSCTHFGYSDLRATAARGGLNVAFRVTTTGTVTGDEVPQVYLDAPASPPAGVAFDDRALAVYGRITLRPGQSQTVQLHVPVGAENLCYLAGCTVDLWLLGPAPARAWDDLRLVSLKLIFLIVTRAASLLGLSRPEWWWKDAEILMLRHQLAVATRERPRAHSRLTWPDRPWLGLLAGTVPAERLAAMRLIVTPGTIVRWQRDIVRRRWARLSRRGRSGRPATHRKVRSVVLALARENESWGYRRIHGELAGLGITVAPSTVWQILNSAGINRAPPRDGPGWAEFLRSQAQGILSLDFFTAGLLNGTKVYVLAVIEHGTRRIQILGATEHPVQSQVVQQARNPPMDLEDAGTRAKFVLHDRDASFSATFDSVFQAAGIRVIRSAVQAPRMNSIMERWIGNCGVSC